MNPNFLLNDVQVNGQPVASPTTYVENNILSERTWIPTPSTCEARLTLSAGVAVPIGDVTAATTLYLTPFRGNRIATYDDPAGTGTSTPIVGAGGNWIVWSLPADLSVALTGLTANLPYDVFVQQVSGVLTLSVVAWTNATTRATALVLQDGVYCLTGTLSKRYVGTICITGTTGQCEDSAANRFVWNAFNRVPRKLAKVDSSASLSWTYTTATWRAANANNAYRVNWVTGLAAEPVDLSVYVPTVTNTGSATCSAGIGLDTTTANSADSYGITATTSPQPAFARAILYPATGSHYAQWTEISTASGTTTWSNAAGSAGLTGSLLA